MAGNCMGGLKVLTLVVCALAGCLEVAGQPATISTRVANTTLQMPATIQSSATYSVAQAFPGLSFSHPIGIVSAPGETTRLFILEQDGRIDLIPNLASPTKTVFLDITSRVLYDGSEKGLLSVAFHPNFAANRYFYVWYCPRTGENRLSRFEADPANPSVALPDSELILLNQQDEAPNHNGGTLLFGPDGYLYLSIGDEGHNAWLNNYQRIDRDFFSCILRIDVDKRPGSLAPNPHPANTINGTINYAVPPDNPFVGATSFNGLSIDPSKVRTEFWAAGLRNPWRMAFDSSTGLLYCGDVGQSDREEVDIIVKGGNYGWPYREGYLVYNGFGNPPSGFNPVPPITDYAHGSGQNQGNSITGGFVYRGTKYPDLDGAYIFSDYVSGNIWTLRYQEGQTSIPFTRIAGLQYISSFGLNPYNGDILLCNHGANRIERLVRSPGGESPGLPTTLSGTGAFSDLATLTPNPGISEYNINVPFWSDNAIKRRWFSIPNTSLTIGYQPANNWSFPAGTVWIKHFDLEMTKGDPSSARRIETRFLVKNQSGIYGVTYRWDSANNATLVSESGLDEAFVINDGGVNRSQVWRYPSRSECLICHNPTAGFALGFHSPQMNRDAIYQGATENQIVALSRAGYLNSTVTDVANVPKLAAAQDTNFPLEHRARSYLAANCVYCHQPGGTAQGLWDARITTPLQNAGIIDGALVDYMGDSNNRVVKPGVLANSVMYSRVANFGQKHMPPLATSVLDAQDIALLRDWILSLQPPTRPSPPRGLRILTN
jgi:glucose/arabinose dehydrogenase